MDGTVTASQFAGGTITPSFTLPDGSAVPVIVAAVGVFPVEPIISWPLVNCVDFNSLAELK